MSGYLARGPLWELSDRCDREVQLGTSLISETPAVVFIYSKEGGWGYGRWRGGLSGAEHAFVTLLTS